MSDEEKLKYLEEVSKEGKENKKEWLNGLSKS
jgi:hypothetical protein